MLNKKFRENSDNSDNTDRKKGNEKRRSFNKKHKQSRKKEINIRMRVPTTQNFPAEKDYNESNSSGGKWNGNKKSLSTYPSTHVRADPLLRILKKTKAKNDQDKIFLPTFLSKIEFSRHNNEALIYPSVQKDPGLSTLKAAKAKGKQEKSVLTIAQPKNIEKQRVNIRYRNIIGNTAAQISTQAQV